MSGPPSRLPSRRDLAVAALAVLLGFVLFSADGRDPGGPGPVDGVGMAVLALAMGLPLAWRRSRPLEVAAAVVLAATAYALLLGPVPPFALWFALFAAVVHTGPTHRAAVAGVATGAATIGLTGLALAVHDRGGAGLLSTGLLTVVVGLAAALVRTERGRLHALRQRAVSLERERDAASREAAVEERLRIARDLHDLVGHGLSTVALQSSAARLLLDDGDLDGARQRLTAVETASRTALREMRQLLGVLRDDDAERRPSPGLADVAALVADSGVTVELHVDEELTDVPADVGLTAYRVVQEGLTNAGRHARGAPVRVTVVRDGAQLRVDVADDGGTADAAPGGGHGLLGLRERVTAQRGTLEAGAEGAGWRLSARLPLEER